MVPTPTVSEGTGPQENKGRRGGRSLRETVHMWPTPSTRETGGGDYQDPEKIRERMAKGHQTNLGDAVKLWPTPDATPRGPAKEFKGERPSGAKEALTLETAVTFDQKSGGQLNPMWVAWLMGYPTEYLNSVRWETQSSRKSRKKSDKR